MERTTKTELKKQIQTLKGEIVEAIRAKDHVLLKKLRRHVKGLKSQTRRLASTKPPTSGPVTESTPPAA